MDEEIKFEKALDRLEKIVEELESGNLPLDEALKKYEEGVKLSRACQQRLDQAGKKIDILTRALDGSFKKEPFEFEEGEEAVEGKASKKAEKEAAKTKMTDDEDMLF